MKTKKLLGKLPFNKVTVANLTLGKMNAVKGGVPPVTQRWPSDCCLTTEPTPEPETYNNTCEVSYLCDTNPPYSMCSSTPNPLCS
jgi:hypothetical protein